MRRQTGSGDDAAKRKGPFGEGNLREVSPAQVFHDDVRASVGRSAEVEDRYGIGVAQTTGRARLVEEACSRELVAREVRMNDLDRDRSPESDLLRAVDMAHPANADEMRDAVASG